MYMDILVPMTILLLGLSPTMCVHGDFRPLASSTRSSSDGTSMQNWVLPASDVPCNGCMCIQIECGKHVSRPVGTQPDIIVVELCLIVSTSALLTEIPATLCAFTGQPQLQCSQYLLAIY